jgi:exopolysaccharide production protein ExoZ
MSLVRTTVTQPAVLTAKLERIRAFDGLRGLAALLVFFVHFHTVCGGYATPGSNVGSFFEFASTLGRSGVNLFFLLSGYLIYAGLIRKPTDYGTFLRRRLKRIYPAFLCVFAAYLMLHLAVSPDRGLPSDPWTAAAYVLQNLALLPGLLRIEPLMTVAWSLSYQFFFYCTIPLLIGITRMRRWTGVARCYFFLGLFSLYGLLHLWFVDFSIPQIAFFPAAHPRMLMFIVGILAYEAHSLGLFKRFTSGWLTALFVFAGFAAYYLLQTNPWLLAHFRTAISSVAALSVAWFWLVLNCFRFAGLPQRVFSLAPLRFMGKISYSFYLIQGLTLHGLLAMLAPVVPAGKPSPVLLPALFPVALAATVGAAFVLFRLVEKPLLPESSPAAATGKV